MTENTEKPGPVFTHCKVCGGPLVRMGHDSWRCRGNCGFFSVEELSNFNELTEEKVRDIHAAREKKAKGARAKKAKRNAG